jgi:hypothetical protein
MKPITLGGALLLLLATASFAGGTNNDIVELFLPPHGSWLQDDLFTIVNKGTGNTPPAAAGDPFPYVALNIPRVVYRGQQDSHIHELYLLPGGSWLQDDLFQVVINGGYAAPVPAAGDPFPYVTNDGFPHVVYLGTDQYIHQLSLKGTWFPDDPCCFSNPVLEHAGGDPAAYVTPDGIPRIVYTGRDSGHIHQLSLQGFWSQLDLSNLASNDCHVHYCDTKLPIGGGHLFPYVSNDGFARVVYRGTDQDIHELYLAPGGVGGWFQDDLFQNVKYAPPAQGSAASDPFPYTTKGDGITARVVYRGYDNDIHELFLPSGGPWFHDDLKVVVLQDCHSCSVAPAAGSPFAYVTDGIPRVVYSGQDHLIHELYLQNGWFPADLMVGPSAILTGGNPRAYFPDGFARVVFRSVP